MMKDKAGNSSASSAQLYDSSGVLRRPSLNARQGSYTHSFPKDQPRGLSPATIALAKELLRPEGLEQTTPKAELFFGGLQWLLDSTVHAEPAGHTQSERHTLREDVIRLFNAKNDGEKQETDVANDSRSTGAWVSDQSDHMEEASASP